MAEKDPKSEDVASGSKKNEDSEKTVLRPRKPAVDEEKNSSSEKRAENSITDAKTVIQPRQVVRNNVSAHHTNSATSRSSRTSGTAWAQSVNQDATGKTVEPGTVLKERFELLEILGHGGMGTVYKAIDRRDIEAQHSSFLAIKVLNDEFRNDTDLLRALHGEARKTQHLAHPSIVTVFDFDRDESIVFMTMEYMDGTPLDDFIKSHPNGIGKDETINIVNQMASALVYAHSRHIIHSDFKPSNIFIGQKQRVKVLDFGIARVAKSEQKSTDFDAGILGGLTPAYASLEMFNDDDPDPSDDLYALACVTYELLTGKHPFNNRGANVAKDEGLVPEKIKCLNARQWKALAKGLAFERANRFATIQEFKDGLNAEKSKLPIIFGSISIGLIIAGILAKDPLQEYWKQIESEGEIDQLEPEIKKGDVDIMLKALALVEVLSKSNSYRIETEDRISEEILKHIALDGYDFVSRLITHFDQLSNELRQKVLFQGKDGLLSFYEKEMDIIISSPQKSKIFNSVESLLKNAEGYYSDSFKLRRLQEKKNDLILKLDERFSESLKQKKMLSDPDRDDIVDVLSELIRINPDHPLVSDARAEGAYIREVTAALEHDQIDVAKQLVVQGLVFFSNSISLADLADQVDVIERYKEKQHAISGIEKQIKNLIEIFSGDVYSWVQQVRPVFVQLITLQADSQMVAVVKSKTEGLLNKKIDILTETRKWNLASSLIMDLKLMITEKAFIESESKVARIKAAFELKVKQLFQKIKDLVALDQTEQTIIQINQIFTELNKLNAEHPLIQLRREQISSRFLQIAEDMRSEAKWEKAFQFLKFAGKINTEPQFLQRVDAQKTEMIRAKKALENMAKEEQALAQKKELELREKRRQQKITVEVERFNAMIATMSATEESALAAKLILDSISALDAKKPILETGFVQIENVFIKQINLLISQQQWENANNVLKEGMAFSPQSEQLKQAAIQIDNGLTAQLNQQQQLKIQQYKNTLEALIQQPSLDKKWKLNVNAVLTDLEKILDKDSAWLNNEKTKIVAIYLAQAKQLIVDKRISGAKEILKLALKIDSRSKKIIDELKSLEKEQILVDEKNRQNELKAERDGLKQSFEIQLKANKVRQALASLKKLKKIEGVDKNYTNRIATKLFADAYFRLASIQMERSKVNSAMALVRKGLRFDKRHDKLNQLRLKLKKQKEEAEIVKRQKEKAYEELLKKSKPDVSAPNQTTDEEIKSLGSIDKPSIGESNKTAKAEIMSKEKPGAAPKTAKGRACLSKNAGYGSRSKARCYDYISGSIKGPILAVIPAGEGNSSSYAIGTNEVSVKEYNYYCKLTGKCSSHSGRAAPITGITLQQAKGYVQWLSKVTGFDYRLPNKQQWLHAAKSGGKKAVTDFNCKLVSGGSIIKGKGLVSAKSGKKNAWGLRNYIGNAQEWVLSGGAILAMGGAHTDSMTVCDMNFQRSHSGGRDKITGFRVVRNVDS
ncbi:MAG: protein kinase [Methylococcaceae bacterium]|nr:protein kinase [Methylococcaceae bacterium]